MLPAVDILEVVVHVVYAWASLCDGLLEGRPWVLSLAVVLNHASYIRSPLTEGENSGDFIQLSHSTRGCSGYDMVPALRNQALVN